MNIAVDVLSIRPDGSAGGATGYAIELIKGMALHNGIKVFVLCADWNIEYLSGILPDNVELRQMTGTRQGTGIAARGLAWLDDRRRRQVLKRDNIDILFCPFSAPTYRSDDVPTVSAILDIQHEFYPQFFSREELRARRNFYRDIVAGVERVVCISNYTKKTFCEKYGFPEERAETVYIAVQDRFTQEDEKILEKLQVDTEQYIVYSANFWEHKNHRMLLVAYEHYVRNGGRLKLVLTGNPLKEQKYYDDALDKMGIKDMVRITGYVTEQELYAILKHSKGIIYPSLFEGFGIPVVEAMQLNKLIACSNMTSLPEIGCSSIHYFDPRNPDDILKGIEYLDKKTINDEIISEYSRKLEEYKTDVMVDNYIKIFEDTIKNRDKYRYKVFVETVQGIYQDGWAGKRVVIRCKDKQGSSISIKVMKPAKPFIPMYMRIRNGETVKKYVLNAGHTYDFAIPVMSSESEIIFDFSYTWTPRHVMKIADDRHMSVHLDECCIIGTDGMRTSLLGAEDMI